jgi:ribosomal protein S18 acetylase RimI-like enzyme
MEIEVVSEVTDELCRAFERLVPQLSTAPVPGREVLEEIVRSEAANLLAVRHPESGEIAGVLTLVLFRVPTGRRAWIEDMVVDEQARGQGIGEALLRAAIDLAEERGAQGIGLTSRESREAANRLYQRAGFQLRRTNLYHLPLPHRAE